MLLLFRSGNYFFEPRDTIQELQLNKTNVTQYIEITVLDNLVKGELRKRLRSTKAKPWNFKLVVLMINY